MPLLKCREQDILTEQQKIEIKEREKYLRSLGVYIRLYAEEIEYPEYIDGIHNYISDSTLARKLVEQGKEIPDDLKERLLYYKPIMEEQLK
jgi:hypothetical protein